MSLLDVRDLEYSAGETEILRGMNLSVEEAVEMIVQGMLGGD
ncbi:MAG: hypothetical protein ACOCSQ_05830 [Planctomycetota bacterium]